MTVIFPAGIQTVHIFIILMVYKFEKKTQENT